MSYCRFSSDGWMSDVYIYVDATDCIAVHVASNRRVNLNPHPKAISSLEGNSSVEAIKNALMVDNKWYEDSTSQKIGLKYDGESKYFEDVKDCVTFIQELKELGYHIPEGVVEAIIEDSKCS